MHREDGIVVLSRETKPTDPAQPDSEESANHVLERSEIELESTIGLIRLVCVRPELSYRTSANEGQKMDAVISGRAVVLDGHTLNADVEDSRRTSVQVELRRVPAIVQGQPTRPENATTSTRTSTDCGSATLLFCPAYPPVIREGDWHLRMSISDAIFSRCESWLLAGQNIELKFHLSFSGVYCELGQVLEGHEAADLYILGEPSRPVPSGLHEGVVSSFEVRLPQIETGAEKQGDAEKEGASFSADGSSAQPADPGLGDIINAINALQTQLRALSRPVWWVAYGLWLGLLLAMLTKG